MQTKILVDSNLGVFSRRSKASGSAGLAELHFRIGASGAPFVDTTILTAMQPVVLMATGGFSVAHNLSMLRKVAPR